ncbi:MAG: ComEC/Rec2 family competence protein [Spirochaetota bacterium]
MKKKNSPSIQGLQGLKSRNTPPGAAEHPGVPFKKLLNSKLFRKLAPGAGLLDEVLKSLRSLTFAQALAVILLVSSLIFTSIKAAASRGLISSGLISHHSLAAFTAISACCVTGAAVFLFVYWTIGRKPHSAGKNTSLWTTGLLFFLIFWASFAYTIFRGLPFYRPPGAVTADIKLVSEPDIHKSSFQAVSRIKNIRLQEGMELNSSGGEKVLARLPFTRGYPERGSVIRARGIFLHLPYDSAPEYAAYLESTGIKAIMECYSRDLQVIYTPSSHSILGISNKLKRYVRNVNQRLLLYPHCEFANSLFTGNRQDLPRKVQEWFKNSGTMHILAVSGLHVGFLSMFVLLLLGSLRIRRGLSYLLLMGVIIFYMVFIGSSPSVRRASIMGICGIVVFLFDRDRNYVNALAIAFVILWITNPLIIHSPGFLLSFLATFGILFLVPHFYWWIKKKLPAFLAGPVSVTLAAQIYLFPVMMAYFGRFAYVNLAANLPIVPLAGLSFMLQTAYLIFYPVFLPLAKIFAEVNLVVISALIRLAEFFSRVPVLEMQNFPRFLIPIYVVAVTWLFWLLFKKQGCTACGVAEHQEVTLRKK